MTNTSPRKSHSSPFARWHRKACLLAAIALCAGGPTLAQEAPPPGPPRGPAWARNLGAAGLLAEFSAYDTYGAVQQRLGQSRSQIQWAQIPGNPIDGYEDSADVLVVPVDLTIALPFDAQHSFLRVSGVSMYNWGDENLTWVDIETRRLGFQYLYAPNPNTIFAIGGCIEKADITMRHSVGSIGSDGLGLRADIVHKFSPRWGFALRAELIEAEADTRMIVGRGLAYGFDQDYRRLYIQANVVGTYTRETLGWLPAGWVLQPGFSALFERNSFDDTTDTFGRTVGGTVGPSDRYATVSTNLCLASAGFRPWRPSPYFEVGFEREIRNDLNRIVDEPNILRSAVGFSLNLTHGARLDLEYSRHDGLEGLRRDQALTVHLGMLF